jgi:uncharacterized integral membrane protein
MEKVSYLAALNHHVPLINPLLCLMWDHKSVCHCSMDIICRPLRILLQILTLLAACHLGEVGGEQLIIRCHHTSLLSQCKTVDRLPASHTV